LNIFGHPITPMTPLVGLLQEYNAWKNAGGDIEQHLSSNLNVLQLVSHFPFLFIGSQTE